MRSGYNKNYIAAKNVQVLPLLLVVGGVLIFAVNAEEELPPSDSRSAELSHADDAAQSSALKSNKDFVGPEGCVECHQSEYLVWSRTNHATSAYDILRTSSNAKLYATNLGIDVDRITDSPRCLACHSTPQSEAAESTGLVLGVTCESCHDAAGGESGWLNSHANYGPNGVTRENETAAHRQQRIAHSREAGQNRTDDLYSLTKRCYECHLIGDEELVVRGGHHPGNAGFEMTNWFDQQVRHNLFLDKHHNALASSLWADPLWRPNHQLGKEINHRRLMFVVSMLVDLESSLGNRGRATHASFASAAATRIVAAAYRLSEIADSDTTPELMNAISAIAQLESILFAPPANEDSQSFHDAARLIRDIAMKISSSDDGQRFFAADRLLNSHDK